MRHAAAILLLVIISGAAAASELASLREQEARLLQQREQTEANYWNTRKAFIDRRDSAAREYRELEARYEGLNRERNALHEEQLSLRAAVSQLREQINHHEDDIALQNEAYLHIIEEMSQFVRRHMPFTTPEQRARLNRLQQQVQDTPDSLIANGSAILEAAFSLLNASGTASIQTGEAVLDDGTIKRVWKIRLGNVYYAWISTDFSRAALLLPSDSIDTPWQWQENLPSEIIRTLQEAVQQ